MKRYNHKIATASLCLMLASAATATTPPTAPTDQPWGIASPRSFRPIAPSPRRDYQDIIGQFRQTCRFLTTMQEHDPDDADFGGLHEGEGDALWAIVESDNTQESIRVWCEYALYFNDAERFRENVEAAWTYLDSFPAWEESAPGEMYGIHNSGWGLIAVIGDERVYGESRRDYGRGCAELIAEHTPEIEVDHGDALMPLVAGFGAGTLYQYGEFIENDEYKEAALRIGREVKAWIDRNPARLHNNEIWALSGGTAFWGVINSLGRADSAEIADWAISRSDEMDVFAGRGQWNNSWNIWYAHAWLDAYQLTGRDEYLANSHAIVDSLVAQDYDDDGGIPATAGDPANRDQSWVSAYTAWMGLRPRFELLPEVDGKIIGLVSPSTSYPLRPHQPVQLTLNLQQRGVLRQCEFPLSIRGGWEFDTTVALQGWEPTLMPITRNWIPNAPGRYSLEFFLSHEEEADPSDDSLEAELLVVPVGELLVRMRNEGMHPVGGELVIRNLEWEDVIPPETLVVSTDSGLGRMELIAGFHQISVQPAFPYASRVIDSLFVPEDGTGIQLEFTQPALLLIDNDTLAGRDQYYRAALDNSGASFRLWNRSVEGALAVRWRNFQTLLYFTGNRTTATIPPEDRESISAFLAAGGSILISGQNIADDLQDDDFLADILHARHLTDNARSVQINGAAGDPMLDGRRLLLLGNQGANNQNSPSGVEAVNDGIAIGFYANRGDTAAGVRWEDAGGGRGIFLAFGFEGISGQGGTMQRGELMRAALEWLGTPLQVSDSERISLLPTADKPILFPNPFNRQITILLPSGASQRGSMAIYDLQGRQVRTFENARGSRVVWDGLSDNGARVGAGIYFLRSGALTAGAGVKIIYLP